MASLSPSAPPQARSGMEWTPSSTWTSFMAPPQARSCASSAAATRASPASPLSLATDLPAPDHSISSELTPRQVVELLDRYIVGQAAAKKAVANALRSRWRRHKVASPMREEIVPKNILMIGPTGCGKTEIARRLAKLADAPFVKVGAWWERVGTCAAWGVGLAAVRGLR